MKHISSIEAIEFQIASEVRCNDKGEAFYSFRATSRLCGLGAATLSENLNPKEGDRRSFSKLAQYLITQGFESDQLLEWKKTGVPSEGLFLILSFYAFGIGGTTKEKAYESLSLLKPGHYAPKKSSKKTNKTNEKTCQTRLALQLNGQTEVVTLAGNIDILTQEEIIEVKSIKNWKCALGQVLIYGQFYPSHVKRIHLFGETQESYLQMIIEMVSKFDVVVTWES